MLKIFLARHGQNEDNAEGLLNGHRDRPLTQLGIEQAKELAIGIAQVNLHFDYIYTSPLRRASKTADIVADYIHGPEPVAMDNLIERDFGIMSGISQDRIEELCSPNILKTGTTTYFLNPEGAETFPDLLERAGRILNDLQEEHGDKSLLLMTHGDLGKMILASYYGLDWREALTMFHFGNSELLLLSEDIAPDAPHVIKIAQYNL